MSQTPTKRQPLVLRNANFRALWLSSTAGIFGTSVAAVALPLIAAVELDASDFAVAALSGVGFLPWLLFGLPIGALVDRYRRKPVVMAALVLRIAVLMSLPVAFWMDRLTVLQLFVVSFLSGLAAVFSMLAESALLPRAVPREELIEGNGLMTGSAASADAVGRGLGGWLTGVWGASNSLLLQVAASVASLSSVATLKVTEAATVPRAGNRIFRDMGEGLRYSFSTAPLRTILLAGALWNLGGAIVVSLMVIFVVRTLGESGAMLGFLTASTALGGTLGGLTVRRATERWGSGTVWRFSMVPAVLGYSCLLLMTPGWGLVPGFAGLFLAGFAISMNVVVGTSFRQRVCPPSMLGRLGSASRMVTWGMLAVAGVIGGALADPLGVRGAIITGLAIAVLAPAVAAFGPLRGIRNLEDLEPVPEENIGKNTDERISGRP
ncbi:MFS transporter [Arthrobacter sp. zg-Y820]|uniref:MFS transporter n=1 Tax=unclassified Arthrobacter TaxID=235627 RepID=UPI001E51A51D|nr:MULTISPECIES: MFS transporter [unclassified Arthrobacter]MCC9196285.1 MFS transporter [Arthrobacter sp. zg-Y820]MDK1279146.1 MFS transporter [Arthrobacter sp. zg.Y820]WIB08450.1 MFS transporter [Arthrobacter sp. zg-Y820]